MGPNYQAELSDLLKQATVKLVAGDIIDYKNVFGAAGGYVEGKIFISCGKFGVALRLSPDVLAAVLNEAGVKKLRYFTNGHVKKEYAVLPRRILEDKKYFNELLNKSIKYIRQA